MREVIGLVLISPAPSFRERMTRFLSAPERGGSGRFQIVRMASRPELLGGPVPGADAVILHLPGRRGSPGDDDPLRALPDIPVLMVGPEPARAAGILSRTDRPGGWLPEDFLPDELSAALTAAVSGLRVWDPRAGGAFIMSPTVRRSRNGTGADRPAGLSPREREVLELLAGGFSNAEIGGYLGISENTVKYHLGSLFRKLDVSGRTEAVRIGIREGLLSV